MRVLGSVIMMSAAAALMPLCAQMPMVHTSERAVFVSGDVALEGGSKLTDPVLVRRICKGSVEGEIWTDSKGRFSFKIQPGGNDAATPDAGQATRDADLSRPIGDSTYYQNPVMTALRDCVVQAVLAGFWSDRVNITAKTTMDDMRVGTILLHPSTHGEAMAISATTLQAPDKARKAFEKGLAAGREQKWDAAAQDLSKAVEIYPKFAAAWFELGVVRERTNNPAGAADAWKQAIQSDPKYLKPYQGLATLAERQQNWIDLEKYSRGWIELAPDDFPAAYLYNAFANAQLNQPQQAEVSARKGLSVDKQKKIPRLSYVLGLLLIQKHDYAAAAESLRNYLALAPNAKDAAVVREELNRIAPAGAPR